MAGRGCEERICNVAPVASDQRPAASLLEGVTAVFPTRYGEAGRPTPIMAPLNAEAGRGPLSNHLDPFQTRISCMRPSAAVLPQARTGDQPRRKKPGQSQAERIGFGDWRRRCEQDIVARDEVAGEPVEIDAVIDSPRPPVIVADHVAVGIAVESAGQACRRCRCG